MRRRPTDAERILWDALRRRELDGAKFRRQVPIGRYIVDFLCPASRLVVELDGGIHKGDAYDREREAELRALGFVVVRFRNEEVTRSLGAVLQVLRQSLRDAGPVGTPSLTAVRALIEKEASP